MLGVRLGDPVARATTEEGSEEEPAHALLAAKGFDDGADLEVGEVGRRGIAFELGEDVVDGAAGVASQSGADFLEGGER